MGKAIEQRLVQLEHRHRAQLGYRFFVNSLDDLSLFYEQGGGTLGPPEGKAYTRAEIDLLTAQGWQCIVFDRREGQPGEADPADKERATG